jgi:hypothetical protein
MNKDGKKTTKGLYQILGILLLCLTIVALSYNVTLAWFRDQSITSNSPNVTIVGTIDLDVSTNFKFDNLAFAPDTTYTEDANGDSLATTIKTSDIHDIDGAFVRVKWTNNREEITLVFDNNVTTNTTYSASDENKWYYNSADEFYYYIGVIYGTEINFNIGYYVDNTLYNEKADAPVEMSFLVEGIQKQYGAYKEEWTTAPEIFKSYASSKTGY